MKKAFIILSSAMLLISTTTMVGCGGNKAESEANKETETTAAAETPAAPDPAIGEGLELIGKSDCLTCHKLNEPAIGPAYSAVAARYANNQTGQDSLALKIIKGGTGNWGQIAMTPHPDLSEADAKKMVAYIMSVKPE